MGGRTKGKLPADTRKPKHSNDQARANKKSSDGSRDAATVSIRLYLSWKFLCVGMHQMPPPILTAAAKIYSFVYIYSIISFTLISA